MQDQEKITIAPQPEWVVQTQMVMEDVSTNAKGVKEVKTKLVRGQAGPFSDRVAAEQFIFHIYQHRPTLISATAHILSEEATAQVPPSEEILAEMVRQGKVPGVPADAEVRMETQADNTVPFPAK